MSVARAFRPPRKRCPMPTVRAVLAFGVVLAVGSTTAFAADPNLACHKKVVSQLEKYKKTQLKLYQKCLDKEKGGDVASCLDAVAAAKLGGTAIKVRDAIAKKCTPTTLSALGYRIY